MSGDLTMPRAAARRDRPGARRRRARPDHGRADRVAHRQEVTDNLFRVDPRAAGARRRDDLHLAPARGAARRSPTASPCCATGARSARGRWRDVNREPADPDDGRPRAAAVFPKRDGAARRAVLELRRRRAARGAGVRDVDASRCARARSSGWPGWSARDAPSWRARSSASRRPTRGEIRARGRARAHRLARPMPSRSASPTCRRTVGGTAWSSRCRWRERHAGHARQPRRGSARSTSPRARARRRLREAARREDGLDPTRPWRPVGGQPAEGGAGPLAG